MGLILLIVLIILLLGGGGYGYSRYGYGGGIGIGGIHRSRDRRIRPTRSDLQNALLLGWRRRGRCRSNLRFDGRHETLRLAAFVAE